MAIFQFTNCNTLPEGSYFLVRYVNVYQRVNLYFPMVFPMIFPCSYGFSYDFPIFLWFFGFSHVPTVFPFSYGFSHGFSHFSYGFPTVFPMFFINPEVFFRPSSVQALLESSGDVLMEIIVVEDGTVPAIQKPDLTGATVNRD